MLLRCNPEPVRGVVEVPLGATVTIECAENPTTGYRWLLDALEGIEVVQECLPAAPSVGAGGMRRFLLTPGLPEIAGSS